MWVERWTSPTGTRRLLTKLGPSEADRYRRVTALALPHPPRAARSFGCERPPRRRTWREERAAWRRAMRLLLDGADVALASDVAACYPSIGPRAIRMASTWAGGDPEPLLAFLAHVHEAGATGLPIGPGPSATIADAVLVIADRQAGAAGVAPVRWVDDVVFAGNRGEVARAARAWRTALRDLGLREHDGKRRTIDVRGYAPAPSLTARPERVIMRSS
jgi:hypothetical protein